MPTESRRGLGEPDGDVDRGRGRITKARARKIREQCREILKKPDDKITEEDKAVLAQYVGAGGTDEEGSSNSGVLYEFYTPRNVISKVWELVDKYNPRQDKSVIEPSSGIGRFAEGRSEKFTMFELEEDSARIARLLHPDAEIVQGAFQENFMKQKKGRFTKDFEKFDVAVGNPPYGAYTGKYKGMGEGKDFKRYESYFMARTLDTVKDGGVMAMVVPSGFLNGGSAYGKDLEKIAEKAELLEAWRLPNGTFDSTDVGTDIVVFRKGNGTTVDALKNYFTDNPDHIAGEIATRNGRFGEETYIKPKDGETFESAVEKIEVGQAEFKEAEEAEIQEDVEFGAMQSTGEKSKRQKASESEKAAETMGGMVKTRDEGVQFSELGFDHITVDEVHNFRNLFKMPRHMNKEGESEKGESNEFDGLGSGGEPSNRAMKLFAVTQLIQRHNEGRNTFLLSATPFQNSPTEVYSILSYMARDKLKEQGFYSLEQFISNFCKVQREYVVKANRVTEAPVVKGFENLTELQGLLTNYMDKVDGEEAGVVRPYKRMHAPELELSPLQKAIMDECAKYIEEQETTAKVDREDGYMFRAMNAMKFCAISPALVSPDFIPEGYEVPPVSEIVESSPKLKFVCDSIIEQYKKAPSHGQIMYMPLGVEQHPQVKNYLIRHGIPKEAVEIMPKGTSEKLMDRREEIKNDFNDIDGKCKILIGGQDIKEGVTLNGNTTSIYCTQLDWNPTDVQQLWGRGWRQGNKQGIVHCVVPLMHDSLDPMIYQKHDEKSSRTDDLYSYKGDLMNSNDVNPEELKFALIKDPAKRADLQVMEFTEKNKSDQKMYGQLIDVLHKQIGVAFRSDKELELEAQPGMTWSGVAGEEKEIEQCKQEKQKIKEFAAKLKKDYKGKESSFNVSDVIDEYDSISSGWAVSRYNNFATFLQNMDKAIARVDDRIASAKGKISTYNKNLKKLRGQRDACLAYLASKGMKTQADCESKIQDYVSLMDACRDNVAKAKDMREQFYKEAVAYNKANEKKLLSVDELVRQNVDGIMGDLHPMDEEFKAKIKAENDKRFGREVEKSWELAAISELSKGIDERQRAYIAAEKKVKELESGSDLFALNVAKSEARMAKAALDNLRKSLVDAELSLKKSEETEASRRRAGFIDVQKSFAGLEDAAKKDRPLYIMKDGRLFVKKA